MADFLSPEQRQLLAKLLGQEEKNLREGIYTMALTSYSPARLAELQKLDCERYQIRAARAHRSAGCPACGRLVLKRELVRKGCYLCGWRGTKEEIEQARSEDTDPVSEDDTVDDIEKRTSYRIRCPQCGTGLVREQVIEKRCYICGWKLIEGS